MLSAAGDAGAADVGLDGQTYFLDPVTSWPASDPLVTAVGGTELQLNANGQRTAPDRVWNDTYRRDVNQYLAATQARTRWPAGAASPPSSPGRRTRTVCPTWSAAAGACRTSR